MKYTGLSRSLNSLSIIDRKAIIEKFKTSFTKTETCWIYGRRSKCKSYGFLNYNNYTIQAHALSWMISNNSDIPDGMVVRHTCDNRPCVNPEHLILGTQAQNMRDMVERGRSIKKIEYSHVGITEEKILSILLFKGNTRECSKHENLSETTVANIRYGLAWAHIHPEIKRQTRIKRTRISEEDMLFIKNCNMSKNKLSAYLKIDKKTLNKILNNEPRKIYKSK